MIRNDYRRALIMLRGLRQGVSGYVRLERRTLIGTMQFTINGAPQDVGLYGLLLYEQNGLWRACALDKLGPARGGQAGMVYRFDPRSICGRSLEQYRIVAVAGISGDMCELLLAGYLNGSFETDWPQVRQAACEALVPQNLHDLQPNEDDAAGVREAVPVPPISVGSEEPGEQVPLPSSDVFDQPAVATAARTETLIPAETDAFDIPAHSEKKNVIIAAGKTNAPDQKGEAQAMTDPYAPDTSHPWPGSIEPLRRMFQTLPAAHPFDMDGFTLVKAPIASTTGLDHCVVGISAEGGRPTRVLYGVPGHYAPMPPSGLEGYEWLGDSDNGYWVIVRPVE